MTFQEVKRPMKSKLYQEEFDTIFNDRKAFCVRGALVVSAFVEGQILLLAKFFLESKGVIHKPESRQEYFQSLNVLATNKILNTQELKQIKQFREERNKAIHGIFKGMTRREWEKQNNKVVRLGRPIIMNLDKKLYSEGVMFNQETR
jgi:hypothetical protein